MAYIEIDSEEAIKGGRFTPISEEEAKRAKKPPSPLAPAYETLKSIGTAWGPAEVGAEIASGIPAFIAGGITAGAEAISPGISKKVHADKLVELLESPHVMYRPKTAAGQQLEGALANIFETARETGQKVADVALEKTGSPVLSTILGTATGGIPEILMAIVGIKRGLRPKVKAPRFPTTEEWAELKRPPPEKLEYKPRVEPRILEVPPELGIKGLPPGQGFTLKEPTPQTILRSKPPRGKEVLISESGEPITPEKVIPTELKTLALPPGQGFQILPEKPKTILRQPPPMKGKPIEITPEGEPIYPPGMKPVMEPLPLTEVQKMKTPVVTPEGETIGIKPIEVKPKAKVEALKPTEPLPKEKVSKEAMPLRKEIGKKIKQPWEMTRDEYKEFYHLKDEVVDLGRKSSIRKALSEGKSVPPEVLSDYPEIKAGPPRAEIVTAPPEAKAVKVLPQTFRKYVESQGIKWKDVDTKHPKYEELKTAWDILKSEKGAIQLPTLEDIKRATNRAREWIKPLSTLSEAHRESFLKTRGEAMGKQARVDRIVDHVIDLTKKFPDEAKKEMFEASDRSRRDINTLPPEQARIVKELITVKNIIGDSLVFREMLPEEAVGKLKGEYIKFVYLKHLLGENVEIPIGSNAKINTNALKSRKGLTLEQQKGIGLIEDISIADPLGISQSLSNIVKYDYLEKLAQDPRNVWTPSIINIADMPRKYSESIAKGQATRLSRITGDPHRPVQVGNDWQIMNLQNREFVGKRMGIGELYEEVELYKKMVKANPNSPEIQQRLGIYEKYLKDAQNQTKNVPKDFIQMPIAKSWGPMSGTFSRKEIARDLMSFYGKERGNIKGLTKAIDMLVEIDQKATGLFKIGKVAVNLPTIVRNTISNPIQLNLSGMNFADIIKNIIRTGEDFIKKPPTYTKAFRSGLFKTNWSVTEINEVMNQFRHLKGDTFADVLGAVKNLSKYYGRIDDFFKYTKLLDGLNRGLPFDKAVIEAQKWVMDYSLADPSIKWARRHFIPFASYSYLIAPLVAESAIKRPWVLAKYMALPTAMMALAKELHKDEMTEQDWKALEKTIPEEVTRRQSFLIIPWKIKDKWYWFDYSYFLPWGNYMNAITGLAAGDIKTPFSQFGIGGTPLLTALKTFSSAAMRDEPPKDSFSGYPLYNRLDEPIDKALKVSEYFYNLFAPSMVTRFGALGYTFDIGKEDKYGRVVPAEQAIGRWFGMNLHEADPRLAAIVKKGKINALRDEYLKIMIDPKFSVEEKERYAERFREEIKEIMGESIPTKKETILPVGIEMPKVTAPIGLESVSQGKELISEHPFSKYERK